MTIKEQVKYILRKHQSTKYNRARFMWKYCEEYYGVKIYMMPAQFMEFWGDEAGIERSLRDVLKESEFKLKPDQDAKRYEKSAGFKKQYKTPK